MEDTGNEVCFAWLPGEFPIRGALPALTERPGAYIAKTPGKRIEDIARVLGTTTKDLQLPARKLIAAKQVSTEGVKRATKYFPA